MVSMKHVNPVSGEINNCNATKIPCKFGSEFHTSDDSRAVKLSEKIMRDNNLMFANKSKKDLLSIVDKGMAEVPLKEMGVLELRNSIIIDSNNAGMNEKVIVSSINLASLLHTNQKRSQRGVFKETPYIEHPLRNSLRLLRFGVTDEDVIVASVLHDVVEDGSLEFSERVLHKTDISETDSRKILISYIRETYGANVSQIVENVTNEHIDEDIKKNLTMVEKHDLYRTHVRNNIVKDKGTLLVKLSDFMDNASSLHHHSNLPERKEKTKNQAIKYLPLVNDFKDEVTVKQKDYHMPDDVYYNIIQKLNITKERLVNIIK